MSCIINFCTTGLGGNTAAVDTEKVNRIPNYVSKVTSKTPNTFPELLNASCIRKLTSVLKDDLYPTHNRK